MSYLLANLSAAPFVNKRPVKRFIVTAWVIGAVLVAINVFLWLQYRHDSTALRARLAETRSAIEASSRNVVEMDRELDGLGLAAQNAQVDFLNDRIAERTFPWSILFARIAETLPDGVRLMGLNPVFEGRDQRPGKPRAEPTLPEDELVDLRIQGVAKSDEALYELIDAFFSSPVFDRPRLFQESKSAGEVEFSVQVKYLPRLETPRDTTLVHEPDAEPSRQPAASRAEAGVEAVDEVGRMRPLAPAWRSRWWTWALPLAVALLSAVLLVVHPGRTGAGFAEMEKDLDAETKVLASLVEKERTVTTVLANARSSSEALDELYLNRFSTEAERLTRLITEVKRLAKRAGLEPQSISYPVETIDDYGLVRMSLVFVVTGTYPQLRTLVNLLELSDLFLVLDRVGLSNSASSMLGISLQISTFFVREPDDGEDARAARVTRSSDARPAAEPSSDEPSSAEPSTDQVSGADPSNGELPDGELWPVDPSAAEPSSDQSEESAEP